MFDLSGKTAVVTGGNGGIGLGMARGLAAAGARVVVAARNREKSATAVAELAKLGAGGALAIEVDVTDERSVEALVSGTVERCGALHVLVNNAGINIRKPPHEVSLEEWRRVIDTNLTSAYLCSHAAYAASKGGIVQFTRACASAWAKDNIQVNAILPGWIDTELTLKAREQVPGLHDGVLRRTPAGRWGTADDLRGIAVFLAASASDFITGTAIPVDGGYSIQA